MSLPDEMEIRCGKEETAETQQVPRYGTLIENFCKQTAAARCANAFSGPHRLSYVYGLGLDLYDIQKEKDRV